MEFSKIEGGISYLRNSAGERLKVSKMKGTLPHEDMSLLHLNLKTRGHQNESVDR